MKMLLIVRDPVQRVISDFMLIKHQQGLIRPDGTVEGETIEELLLDSDGNLVYHDFLYWSSYYMHLKVWYEWFPPEMIYIMESSELVNDPQMLLYGVEKFLQIEHAITRDVFYFEEKKGFYCYVRDGRRKCMAKKKGMKHVI